MFKLTDNCCLTFAFLQGIKTSTSCHHIKKHQKTKNVISLKILSLGELLKDQGAGQCLLLLPRIRSAHLEILGFSVGGTYQNRDIFARFKTKHRK